MTIRRHAMSTSRYRFHHYIHSTLPCPLLASVVMAAVAPVPFHVMAAEPAILEDIVVTARRREERLVDVPVAISTFSARTLENTNAQTVKDLAVRIPNFSITESQQPGVAFINVRGIGQARNGDSPLAVVVDGVQINSAYQITQQFLDIESVEVLRGPQGALYGRNAIGGAIVINTRKPSDEFSGQLNLAYGTGNDFRANGYVSGPLVEDKLAFKVAGYYRDFDGDIDSLYAPGKANPEEQKNVRAGLYFTPTETISFDLRYAHLDQDASGAWFKPGVPGSHGSNIVADWNGTFINSSMRKSDDISFRADFDFSFATLTAITGYSKIKAQLDQDLDLSPFNLFNASQTTKSRGISQEVRLVSASDQALQWTIGGYYLDINYRQDTIVVYPVDPMSTEFNPPGSMIQVVPSNVQDNESYAVFGQVSYRTEGGIELTAGGRYDVDKRQAVGRPGLKFDSFQPRISLSYFMADDQQVYASVARGYRSGGYNAVPGPDGIYDAEKVWTYEVGFKGVFDEGRATISLTAFYNDISDRQLYAFDFPNASQIIRNPIDKSRAYGVEAELAWRPIAGLDLMAALGWLDTKVKKYTPLPGYVGGRDFTGMDLPYSSPITYSFAGQYDIQVSDGFVLTPRIEVNGSGPWYWEVSNDDRRNNVTLANARLTATFGNMSVQGYVENLFDKDYNIEFLQAEFNGAPFDPTARAPGRRWGIEGRYRF